MPYLPELHAEDDVRAWVAASVLPDREAWVADAAGELTGYLAMKDSDLEHLYVAPGHQGRGIGGALLSKAKELSPGRLRLYAFARNARARAFNEARGFELITGSNLPSAGRVLCCGKNIHRVRYRERDRLAIHYHQAYQVRRFTRTLPGFMLERADSDYPMIHLFDEPQFNTQDGYIGFMLDFFRKLRREERLVFVCLHPNERYHLEILREICERYMFVFQGRVSEAPDFESLLDDRRVRDYLGHLI